MHQGGEVFHPEPEGTRPRAPRLPAAGWLPDPAQMDLERWWDGSRWTARTRDRFTRIETGVVPSGYVPGPPLRATTPISAARPRRKWFGKTVFAVMVLALVASFAAREGLLPGWANLGATAANTVAEAVGPDYSEVGYAVYGTTDLVQHLERGMIAQDSSINVTRWALSVDDDAITDAVYEAFTQNPYVFADGWTTVQRGGLIEIQPMYLYDDAEAERRRAATLSAVMTGLEVSGASSATTAAEKVTLIHDHIASVANYDWTAYEAIERGEDSPIIDRSQQAYGILVEGTAVCNGYAQAFLAMAEAAGLEAIQITGEVSDGPTTGGHAWNKVLVDGTWLAVDVTWDDGDGQWPLSDDYLMVPDGSPQLATRTADTTWVVDAHLGDYGAA